MDSRRISRCMRSVLAGINILFDDSLGLSAELRIAYAVFIVLSMAVAAVSFVYRIISARSMHHVRPQFRA